MSLCVPMCVRVYLNCLLPSKGNINLSPHHKRQRNKITSLPLQSVLLLLFLLLQPPPCTVYILVKSHIQFGTALCAKSPKESAPHPVKSRPRSTITKRSWRKKRKPKEYRAQHVMKVIRQWVRLWDTIYYMIYYIIFYLTFLFIKNTATYVGICRITNEFLQELTVSFAVF